MIHSQEKKRAAFLSICSNVSLIIAKFTVGMLTHSVSIISEAVHSFADLLAAIIAYFSIKKSSEPADSDHQYGHGKFEDLSGLIEGGLIILAAVYIIYEAVLKILHPGLHQIDTVWGIGVMALSIIVNFLVSQNLFKVAKKTDSMALLADAHHLRTDIYTSIGVLIGLVLIKLTGQSVFDPIAAILVAMLIVKTGLDLCKSSLGNLLDEALPEGEKKIIEIIIAKHIPKCATRVENFKTRKAGAQRLVEFNLVVPESMTIREGHDLCDEIEKEIFTHVENCTITIHLEPCNQECVTCELFTTSASNCSELKNRKR